MSRTITVEGDVNSVDTRVILTGQGSVSSPSLVIPAEMNKIKQVIAAVGSDGAAAASAVFFLRIGGNAVLGGEQVLMIGGHGGQTPQAGSDQAPSIMTPFVLENADIDVRPSDTLTISGEMAGADVGDTTFCVTLVYGK